MHFAFQGIGTHWNIEIQDALSEQRENTIKESVIESVQEFEDNYSRFKPTSWIGKLNNEHFITGFPLELYQMLQFFSQIEEITNGEFTPKIGTVLESRGYDSTYSFTSREMKIIEQRLTFDQEKIITSKNTKIDLGGIGKGWLIDKIAHFLTQENIKHFLINGGGDIYASTPNDTDSFLVALENPFNPSESIGEIQVANSSVACSSPNRRSWKDKNTGERHHHLLSYKNTTEVTELVAVFTCATTALQADTASTAIFVSSPDRYNHIANELNTSYLLISPDGRAVSHNYPGRLFE